VDNRKGLARVHVRLESGSSVFQAGKGQTLRHAKIVLVGMTANTASSDATGTAGRNSPHLLRCSSFSDGLNEDMPLLSIVLLDPGQQSTDRAGLSYGGTEAGSIMELVSVLVGPANMLIALVGLGICFWAGRAVFGHKRLAEKDVTLTTEQMVDFSTHWWEHSQRVNLPVSWRKSNTYPAEQAVWDSLFSRIRGRKVTSFLLGLTIGKTLHISWRFLTKISQLFSRVEKRVSCCLALTENVLAHQEQIYDL